MMLEVKNHVEEKTNEEEIDHPAKVEPGVQRNKRATRSESVMNSVVRIVKRGRDEISQSLQAGDKDGTAATCERDIASTVKSWITEREQQRRLSERRNWDLLIKFAQ